MFFLIIDVSMLTISIIFVSDRIIVIIIIFSVSLLPLLSLLLLLLSSQLEPTAFLSTTLVSKRKNPYSKNTRNHQESYWLSREVNDISAM